MRFTAHAGLLLSQLGACASAPRTPPPEDPGARIAVERAAGCRPVFTLEERDLAPRRSCWHRAWEVPAAIVVYPAAAAIGLAIILSPIWAPILLTRK